MAYYDLSSDSYSGAAGTYASGHDLIRPSLRRAFPLPAAEQADEKFRRLLEALAQRGSGNVQKAAQAQPPQGTTLNDWLLVTMLVSTALAGMATVIGGAYGINYVLTFLP